MVPLQQSRRRDSGLRRTPRPSSDQTTFVVLGAGAMGRITIRDFVETAPEGTDIVVADYRDDVARDVVRAMPNRRGITLHAARADASSPRHIAALLRKTRAFGIVNATHHRFNLAVMEGALAAGTHYCDLGGLFHETRRQVQHHAAWKRADRLALLGIGAAPGIVNVLARSAADTMEEVQEIHVAVGGIDRTKGRPASPIGISYSIQTVLEEASEPAALFTGGRLTYAPPMSGARAVWFPSPVGLQHPALTLHSEVATLPRTYARKGIRECSFRIAFDPGIVDKLAFLRSLGLLSREPMRVGATPVVPRDIVNRAFASLPPAPAWNGIPDEYEILRVVVRGRRAGRSIEETVDCHTPGIRAWRMGIDVDTGCPPSIAMQMLARGEIDARGCVPPELAIPAAPFFRELQRRGMTIRRRRSPWS